MINLGKRNEALGVHLVRELELPNRRPTEMPSLRPGYVLVCVADQYIHELLFLCETLEDMQKIDYDANEQGKAAKLTWYEALMTHVVVLVDGEEEASESAS